MATGYDDTHCHSTMPASARTTCRSVFFNRWVLSLATACASIWVVIIVAGCITPPEAQQAPTPQAQTKPQTTPAQYSPEDVAASLKVFTDRFAVVIEAAADQIVAQSDDRQIRRQAVLLKMRAIGLCREVVLQDNPHTAVIDLWAFCAQMRRYLVEGDGSETFGQWQPIVIQAAQEIEADIETFAQWVVAPQVLPQVRRELDAWVKDHPLRGPLARQSGLPSPIDHTMGGPWRTVLNFTSAINPLQGLDATQKRLEETNLAAERIRITAQYLPQQLRWQTELLLYDMEERQTVSSALDSFETLANSFDRLATEAQGLPTSLRTEVSAAMDDLAAQDESLRSTLAQARDTASEIGQSLDQAERVADAVQHAASSLTETGKAWESAAQTFGQLSPQDNGDGADEKPFDINDYERTAQSLTTAAIELRGLASDIRQLIQAGELATALDDATTHSQELIDHVTWRVLWLIVALFVMAIVYRMISVRLTQKP